MLRYLSNLWKVSPQVWIAPPPSSLVHSTVCYVFRPWILLIYLKHFADQHFVGLLHPDPIESHDPLRQPRCDIPAQGLIGLIRILIPISCNFFSKSPSQKNSKVKLAWLGAMGDRPGSASRVRMSEDKVRRKDMCWSVGIFLGS
jgi:hypothetical protein